MEGIPANFTFAPVIEYAPPPVVVNNSSQPSHLIFGRGTQMGGIAGTVIWFGSVALWAYLWAIFTAESIFFIRSGFDFIATVKNLIHLLVYPIIMIPMEIYVLGYKYIYCPIMSWIIKEHPVATVEDDVKTHHFSHMPHPIAKGMNWIMKEASNGAIDLAKEKDLEVAASKEAAQYARYPEYCKPPGKSVSKGCMQNGGLTPSIWSTEYWFCHAWMKPTGTQTYNCSKPK